MTDSCISDRFYILEYLKLFTLDTHDLSLTDKHGETNEFNVNTDKIHNTPQIYKSVQQLYLNSFE